MPERSVRSIIRRRRLGPRLVSSHPDETAREAAKRMAENCCGSVLVMEDDRMLGIFTEATSSPASLPPAGTRPRPGYARS
jgi:CBS domain-containing protein